MNLLKKLLTLSFVCVLLSTNVFSQQTYQQADLIGKNWYFFSGGNRDIVLSYSNTEETESVLGSPLIKRYYLSNNIETTFDNTKVGNVSSGRYIILWNSINNQYAQPHIEVYEIVYLDAQTLKMKYVGGVFLGAGITTWKSTKTAWEDPHDGYDNQYDKECEPNCPE